ncbi:phytosulfokine receptor 1-like [Gossypium raimondii]|uniref:phytosulfokine receptor 1-like n=1 Tax=Gossypium raimondii TaxID=29730 RepID=UPI00227CDD11|nr:phytosulfokine receptor 1-like [Gossypium raimondii]
MTQLRSLHLGSNKLYGSILHSLSPCKSLNISNLGHNNLDGQIPESFKNLNALTVLSLSRTNLKPQGTQHCLRRTAGIDPTMVAWLQRVTILGLVDEPSDRNHYLFYLDLSNNSFTGEIPKGLTQLQALIDIDNSLLGTSLGFPLFSTGIDGATFLYNNIISFLPTLDLSYNMSGTIWPSFGNLRRLHVLNLNKNRLRGSIPEPLLGMKNLETLDLSRNKLSGKYQNHLCSSVFCPSSVWHIMNFMGKSPWEAPVDESPSEAMTVFGPQFGFGVATGFVLTIIVCFMSGWILPRKTTFKYRCFTSKSSHHD